MNVILASLYALYMANNLNSRPSSNCAIHTGRRVARITFCYFLYTQERAYQTRVLLSISVASECHSDIPPSSFSRNFMRVRSFFYKNPFFCHFPAPKFAYLKIFSYLCTEFPTSIVFRWVLREKTRRVSLFIIPSVPKRAQTVVFSEALPTHPRP